MLNELHIFFGRSAFARRGRLKPDVVGGCGFSGDDRQLRLTGTKGDVHSRQPKLDSPQLVTNLPSTGWWNGDTPAMIADGYEYCLGANIVYRAGLEKVKVVNVPFEAIVAGRVRTLISPLRRSRSPNLARRSSTSRCRGINLVVRIQGRVLKGTVVDSAMIKTMGIGVKQATTTADFIANKIKPASQGCERILCRFSSSPEGPAGHQATAGHHHNHPRPRQSRGAVKHQ
jgi:hypothetical protein